MFILLYFLMKVIVLGVHTVQVYALTLQLKFLVCIKMR